MALNVIFSNINDENYMNFEYIIWLYMYKVDYCIDIKNYRGAKVYLDFILNIFNNGNFHKLRYVYKKLAEVCWYIDRDLSIYYYNETLNIEYPGDGLFVEDYNLYSKSGEAKIHSDLSNAYYYAVEKINKFKDLSLHHAEIAVELDPDNELYTKNLSIIKIKIKAKHYY